jgi:hypothetical protein
MAIFVIFVVLFLLTFLGGVALIVWVLVNGPRRKAALNQYALAKGWKSLETDDEVLSNYVPDVLAGKGDGHYYSSAYSFTINGIPAVLFGYQYYSKNRGPSNGSMDVGSNMQTYSCAILSVKPKKAVPTLYIERHSMLNKLQEIFTGREKLKLAGDFSKHFDVYIPNGTQAEAAGILTPDMMTLIADAGTGYTIDFAGDVITFIFKQDLLDPRRIDQVITYAQTILDHAAHKSI